jgi:hypothetical protein
LQTDPFGHRPPSTPFSQWALEKIRTNSAVNPLLWLAALVLPATLSGAYFLPDFRSLFVGTFLFVVGAPVLAYFIWMFKDPNRLQSEDYQIQHQKLMIGDDRNPGVTIEGTAMVPNLPTTSQVGNMHQ